MNTQTLFIAIIIIAGLFFVTRVQALHASNETLQRRNETLELLQNLHPQHTPLLNKLPASYSTPGASTNNAPPTAPPTATASPRETPQFLPQPSSSGSQRRKPKPLFPNQNSPPDPWPTNMHQGGGFESTEYPPFDPRVRPQIGTTPPRQGLPNDDNARIEPVADITAPLPGSDPNDSLTSAGYEPINVPRGGMSGNRDVPALNARRVTFGDDHRKEIQARQYPF